MYTTDSQTIPTDHSDALDDYCKRFEEASVRMVDTLENYVSKHTITAPDGTKVTGQTNKDYGENTKAFLRDLKLETKDLDETFRSMGNSFGSAFENAMLKGKGLGNVLQGLENDLRNIMFHSFVTRPLENYVKDFLKEGMETIFTESKGGSSSIFTKFMNYFSPVAKSSTDDVLDLEHQFGDALPKRATSGSTSADKAPTVGKNRSDNINPGSSGNSNPDMQTNADSGNIYNTVHMIVNTPDAQSFRANQGEILAELNRAMQRGQRNM